MNSFRHALVRPPSPRYADHYAPRGISISNDLARRQHDAYVASLRRAGLNVSTLPPHLTHHDCVFIEDTAIVFERRALITRINDVRHGEQIDVQAWLEKNNFEIVHPPPDARIEGGDVLHLDDVTLVGRSARTNDVGIESLRQFMAPSGHQVLAIDVNRCLHLKSALTYLGEKTVLISSRLIDFDLPSSYLRLEVSPAEPHAANVLRVNKFLLVAKGFPETAKLLHAFASTHHLELIELDISEAQKGDGALTCQSIIW